MAEAEPDASLKKFLLDAEKRYDGSIRPRHCVAG